MKKIIVTGGLGFIGSNLIKILLKKDFFNLAVDMVLGSYQVWGNPFPNLFPFLRYGVSWGRMKCFSGYFFTFRCGFMRGWHFFLL